MRYLHRSLFSGTLVTLSLLAFLLLPAPTLAQDSLLINYQGLLTDDSGDPITGTKAMTFKMYDGRGAEVWTETHPAVSVVNGLFTVVLGGTALIPDLRFDGGERAEMLGITIDADAEMSPRTPLTSVPGAALARYLVGEVTTEPGMLLLKNPAGDSAIVLSSDTARTGFSIRGTAGLGYPRLIEFHVTDEEASGVFGNAEPFSMGGNLEITSDADAAGLLMTHGARPDIEISANSGANLVRIHPPDPCVPPDPCTPALELIADTEIHSLKIHPPNPCTSPPCTPAARIRAASQEVDFDLMVSVPSDDEVTPVSMGSSWSPDSSTGVLKITAVAVTGDDYYEESPWSVVVNRDSTSMTFSRTDPTGGTNPKVKVVATSSASTLTMKGEDRAGDPPTITMVANADGAKVGIGTDSLVEALTVMGNGWFSGDVFTFTDTKAKRDVVPIEDALEMVDRLNGYYYDFKADEYPSLQLPRDRQIGFLAHEIKEVVPEAVGENEYGLTGVSYSRLTALLVEALKELKAENEELRSRIVRLEESR